MLLSLAPGLAQGGVFLPTPEEAQRVSGAKQASAAVQQALANAGNAEYVQIDDMRFPTADLRTRGAFTGRKWPNGKVYFSFSPNVSLSQQQKWIEGAEEWAKGAGVSFIPRSSENNYIYVTSDSGNWSYVGMIGGRQDMGLYNWNYKYIIAHEVGHALGLTHEHQRSDRNQYVSVLFQNVENGKENNFDVNNGSENTTTYDFDSVMHYGKTAFSRNGNNTIEPLPLYSSHLNDMGQRSHLSNLDIEAMGGRYSGVPVPVGLVASDGTYFNRVSLTFSPVTDAAGYDIYRALTNDTADAQLILSVTSTQADDLSAASGQIYHYWVRARKTVNGITQTSGFSDSDSGYASGAAKAFTLKIVSLRGSVTRSPNKPTYASGDQVTLIASVPYPFIFERWSGDISTAWETRNPVTITMDSNKTIEAHFISDLLMLTVSQGGEGRVEVSPDAQGYDAGDEVSVTAIADAGWHFGYWKGDVSYASRLSNPLTFTMETDKTLVATFIADPVDLRFVEQDGGSVRVFPHQNEYRTGDSVALTAEADNGYVFERWSGDITVEEQRLNPLYLTLSTSRTITAHFATRVYELDVFSVNGDVSILPNREGYHYGDVVTLRAEPDPGYYFSHWVGNSIPSDWKRMNPLDVYVERDRTLTAVFAVSGLNSAAVVSFKGCDAVYDGSGVLSVTSTSGNSSIKIKRSRNSFSLKQPRSGVFYASAMSILQEVKITGDLVRLYTEVPILDLSASGTIGALTAKSCHIERISAQALGKTRMADAPDSSSPTDPQVSLTAITTSSSLAQSSVSVQLSGVQLDDYEAEQQKVSTLSSSSKKYRNTLTGGNYISFGGVDAGSIQAESIRKVSVNGGAVAVDDLRVTNSSSPLKIKTKAAVFTLKGSAGNRTIVRSGNITGNIHAAAPQVSISAQGGDISPETLIVAGEIPRLEARAQKVRVDGAIQWIGGHVGPAPGSDNMTSASMPVIVSGGDPLARSKDIRLVYGTFSVAGLFVAGGALAPGLELPVAPDFTGAIGRIATQASSKWTDVLLIVGESWANAPIRFKGRADHDAFIEHRVED